MILWGLGLSSLILCILLSNEWRKRYQTIANYSPNFKDVKTELAFSIIICVKGKAPHFLNYLERIVSQNYQNFEIIIVADNVEESVKKGIETYLNENSKIRLIDIESSEKKFTEKKRALHCGISVSQYDWIITIDDDCYPENEYWLSMLNQFIQGSSSDIVLGMSPYISQKGWFNQWVRFDTFHVAANYVYFTLIGKPYMGVGRNMAFRKELWTDTYLNQYKDLGSGDDTTLVQHYMTTKNIKILISPSVYSFPKTNFKDWFFQKIRHIQKGRHMSNKVLRELAFLPVLTIVFWGVIWLWMSYYAFHFSLVVCVSIYILIKTFYSYKIAKIFQWKSKPIFYTIFFDVFYSFWILCLPIFSIFISKKWK